MKVYQILPSEETQSFGVIDPERYGAIATYDAFTGSSLVDRWEPFECHIVDPTVNPGDLLTFGAGTFAFTQRVREALGDLLEHAGEVLPLSVSGKRYYVINVTRFVPLDRAKTNPLILAMQWVPGLAGIAFDPESLEPESLFLVKECPGVLFCANGQRDPAKDFFARCKALGFRGLEFREVWTND